MSFLIRKWTTPTLYGSGMLKDFIKSRSKFVHDKYCPPIPCLHPAVQFLVRTKYEKPPVMDLKKEVFNLADGGAVAFDKVISPTVASDAAPAYDGYVVIIVPGLRESTHSTKTLATAKSLLSAGFQDVFVLNYRDACSIPLKSTRYSLAFGEYNHVNEGVVNIEQRYPDKKIILIGACLGSMCIADYLSTKEASRPSLVGGVCHSCAWNMDSKYTKDTSEPGYSFFQKKLVNDTKTRLFRIANEEEAKIKEEMFSWVDIEKVRAARSIWELDEYGAAQLAGLSGADEYYKRISPINKCHTISKPLVVINSRDDGIIGPIETMDLPSFLKNPNLVLWSTAAGGHVSFVESLFPVRSYLDKVIPDCATLLCDYEKEQRGK